MKERVRPYFWLLAIAAFGFTIVFVVGGQWLLAIGMACTTVAAMGTWLDYRKRHRSV